MTTRLAADFCPDFHMVWGRMGVEAFDNEPVADPLESELKRKLCAEHPLFGVRVTALGFMRPWYKFR